VRFTPGFLLASALTMSACAQEKIEAPLQTEQTEVLQKNPQTEIVKAAQITSVEDLMDKAREDKRKNEETRESMTVEERQVYDKKEQRIREYRTILQQKPNFHPSHNNRGRGVKYIDCLGIPEQGGAVLCQTLPNAKVKIARSEKDFYFENADADGKLIVGFDRDEAKTFVEAAGDRVTFDIKPREYDTSRIDGLPPSQVSTFTEAQLKRIRASSARKKVGFSSRAKEMGFADGFIYPVAEYTKTTNFGAQRILNGEPKRPHYGVDLAASVGTPIVAPADGIVSLADDDLYFEGAMVLLDHGQGLISMYLHTDEILVEPGQAVKRGEQIATVGSKGRSTGPHLCWRLKWRNRNLDPELLTEWPDDQRPQ